MKPIPKQPSRWFPIAVTALTLLGTILWLSYESRPTRAGGGGHLRGAVSAPADTDSVMHVTLEGRSLLSLRAPQASTVRDLLDVVFEDVPTLRPTGTWARGRTLQPRAVYVWSLLDVRRIPPRLGRVVTPVLETIARSPWWAQVPDVVPDFVDLVLDNFDPDQGIEFYHSESGEAAAMLLWPVHDGETLDLGFSEP